MKERIQKIAAPFLALLVLLSTVSWTVDKHLCMGRVMDVAFFAPADDCGMEAAMTVFGESENHCCDDETFTFEGQDDLKLTFNDYDIGQLTFLSSLVGFYFNFPAESLEGRLSFDTYPPPLLVHDLNILYESYLI